MFVVVSLNLYLNLYLPLKKEDYHHVDKTDSFPY